VNHSVKLAFFGNSEAEHFTAIIRENIDGIFRNLLCMDKNSDMYGYCYEALPGYSWRDSMWSRDFGTFLRELAFLGYTEEACAIAECLMKRVGRNADGYKMFPRYFAPDEFDKSGTELDGTCSVLLALMILYKRLPDSHETACRIKSFLTDNSSPIAWIIRNLKERDLLEGTGEFGGGCDIQNPYCNVVQNNIARLTLVKAADLFGQWGMASADDCRKTADKLKKSICRYLIRSDGSFEWCVNPQTMQPDETVLTSVFNIGSGMLNGVLSMCADIYGSEADYLKNTGYMPSMTNFGKGLPVRHTDRDMPCRL